MASHLRLGLSPCPNDTFIFHALLHGRSEVGYGSGISFEPVFCDVQKLNEHALRGGLPVTKVSAGVLPHILDRYRILPSGAALGFGCGPLVVSARPDADPATGVIAVPGRHTTACRLLDLHGGFAGERLELRFDEIMPAIRAGEADFGVIIHEGRFTYASQGLTKILDLGEWWEQTFDMPLPLGAIVARRDLEPELLAALARAIAASVAYAWQNPEASADFVARHAQELEPDVTKAHIDTFVTVFSRDLGDAGRNAILELVSKHAAAMRVPVTPDIFIAV